jgi:hypothetical protein
MISILGALQMLINSTHFSMGSIKRDAQYPGEGLVCDRDGELQTGTIPANPGRVVSLIITLKLTIPVLF